MRLPKNYLHCVDDRKQRIEGCAAIFTGCIFAFYPFAIGADIPIGQVINLQKYVMFSFSLNISKLSKMGQIKKNIISNTYKFHKPRQHGVKTISSHLSFDESKQGLCKTANPLVHYVVRLVR